MSETAGALFQERSDLSGGPSDVSVLHCSKLQAGFELKRLNAARSAIPHIRISQTAAS